MSIAAVPTSDAKATPSAVAFGSLVDLARLQVGSPSAEICGACNTINMGSAPYCKYCTHKLSAFYAANKENTTGLRLRNAVLPRHLLGTPERASLMDFAAFSAVIDLLVAITAYIPIP